MKFSLVSKATDANNQRRLRLATTHIQMLTVDGLNESNSESTSKLTFGNPGGVQSPRKYISFIVSTSKDPKFAPEPEKSILQ